jgi:hypothetical protein
MSIQILNAGYTIKGEIAKAMGGLELRAKLLGY